MSKLVGVQEASIEIEAQAIEANGTERYKCGNCGATFNEPAKLHDEGCPECMSKEFGCILQ